MLHCLSGEKFPCISYARVLSCVTLRWLVSVLLISRVVCGKLIHLSVLVKGRTVTAMIGGSYRTENMITVATQQILSIPDKSNILLSFS